MHASGIVKRLVKSRIEVFTRREIDRSSGFREKQTKAAKRQKRNGTARRGGATHCSVSPVSVDRSLSGYAACPPCPLALPHNAEPPRKPEKRECLLYTQRACRFYAALNTGQKFENRQSFNAVRALGVPPERGQGTQTGKFLMKP